MVLLTLGNLYRIFDNLPTADHQVTATLHGSLERRWAKTDQELMILAVFLNPFIRTRPFNRESFPPITFFHLVRRAFLRLLRQDAAGDTEFLEAYNSYYQNTGFFSDENMWIQGHRKLYEENVCSFLSQNLSCRLPNAQNKNVDLVAIWNQMSNVKSLRGRAGFVSLAVRILSILPNSAGPERVFSEFGMIHTKRRNRLHPQKVHNTSLVRADRLRAHVSAGLIPKRKLRRCSIAEDQAAIAAMDDNDDSDPVVPAADGSDAMTDSIGNDFESMADVLLQLAARESSEEQDSILETTASTHPSQPSASSPVTDPNARIPAYKKIPLEKLFNYSDPGSDIEFFWRVGRAGVDAEEEDIVQAQAGEAEAASEPTAA
jgi:hypothetical protein